MIKVYLIEITRNIAISLDGKKRQSFRKGDKVLVGRDDRIAVLRLGGKLLGEKDLEYKDVFLEKKVDVEAEKPKRGGRRKKADVEA